MFFQVNVRTAMSVGQASGLAMAEAHAAGCEVAKYTPNQVKEAVAGDGAADKEQVEQMVQTLLGLSAPPKPADAADAAALALCHLAHAPMTGEGGRDDRLAAGHAARPLAGRRGPHRGRRGRVPGDGGADRLARLGEVGDEVFLWVHHHIREDAQTLYGFATREERVCFEALLGAHGVGPALALAILSVHGPGALREVIATQDVSALCLVPGRRQEDGGPPAGRAPVPPRPARHRPHARPPGAAVRRPRPAADVTEALAGLGYGADEVRRGRRRPAGRGRARRAAPRSAAPPRRSLSVR